MATPPPRNSERAAAPGVFRLGDVMPCSRRDSKGLLHRRLAAAAAEPGVHARRGVLRFLVESATKSQGCASYSSDAHNPRGPKPMNDPSDRLTRRKLLRAGTVAAAGVAAARAAQAAEPPAEGRAVQKGRIRQTAVSWCYEPMDVETLARHAAAIGLAALENVQPQGLADSEALRAGQCHDGRARFRRRPEPQRKPCHVHRQADGSHRSQRRGRLSQRDHLLRHAPRHARRRRPGQHGARPEAGDRPGRAQEGESLPGGAQQPGQRDDERPSRLHVRQGRMGRRGLQTASARSG